MYQALGIPIRIGSELENRFFFNTGQVLATSNTEQGTNAQVHSNGKEL